MESGYSLGILGLGVMGRSLARNFARHGYLPIGYDPAPLSVDISDIARARTAGELVAALSPPRLVLLMVPAGQAVDNAIAALLPYLQPGDLVIDGGNSHFADSERRMGQLESQGLLFVGMGVSGGEAGALAGPSLMPGGSPPAWPLIREMLTSIAARDEEDGVPCLAWIGPSGSGHFVKMVHNGLEYADMQLLAEMYDLLRRGAGLPASQIAAIFEKWNQGELRSFLLEITFRILRRLDESTGRPLVELILDEAAHHGSGKWASQAAMDLGVAAPTLSAALEARLLSAAKSTRLQAARVLGGPRAFSGELAQLVQRAEVALYTSRLTAYAQGFSLLQTASRQFGWGLDLKGICRIWRAGCIIRSSLLNDLATAFHCQPDLSNLLLEPQFLQAILQHQEAWRALLKTALDLGIPMPATSASIAYFDALRSETLPAGLIQAQRDYFGAHTYRRLDRDGVFHTDWEQSTESG